MPALENGEIPQYHVAAVLERDGLVAHAGLLRSVERVIAAGRAIRSKTEPLAPDQPRPGDAEVMNLFAPKQRVMPVVVAVILMCVPIRLRLGRVVDSAVISSLLIGERRFSGDDRAALLQVQVNLTLQADRKAQIVPSGKNHHSTSRCHRRFNGAVDGLRVQRLAVPGRAVLADVE